MDSPAPNEKSPPQTPAESTAPDTASPVKDRPLPAPRQLSREELESLRGRLLARFHNRPAK